MLEFSGKNERCSCDDLGRCSGGFGYHPICNLTADPFAEKTLRCPECGQVVFKWEEKCPFCGRKM